MDIDTAPAPAAPVPAAPARAAAAAKPRINRRALRELREQFPARNIGKKPRVYCWECNWASKQEAGATCQHHAAVWCPTCRSTVSNAHDHDDYVGHAEVTDRFLDADLTWNWRPMAFDERGLPALDDEGGMWMYLSIGGVERIGYGKPGVGGKTELISNGLKNGGIRFGTALDQRAQTDLHPATKTCPGCTKVSTDPKARFCVDCGHELPVPSSCAGCGRSGHHPEAKFCAGCGHDLSATDSADAEPQYARPDFAARIGSLLSRKRGLHGADRLAELSEILGRDVDDVAQLSPDEGRHVVRILSGGPDLYPPAPTADAPWSQVAEQPAPVAPAPPVAVPTPKAEPAQASPAPVPPSCPPAPAARPKRGGAKSSTPRPAAAAPSAVGISSAHARTINSLLDSRGVPVNDTTARLAIISEALGRTVGSMDEISPTEVDLLILGLGSGDVSVDPPAAAGDTEPYRDIYDELSDQITTAVTDDDAQAIKVEIGKAIMNNLVTKADGATLVEQLEKRGRQVNLAGGS